MSNIQALLFLSFPLANFQFVNPYVYTPVVGEACQRFSHIYVNPEGLHISLKDKGHIYEILQKHPSDDLDITVVTDGSRILGLGDLGLNGTNFPRFFN
jgi:malate dehydrogenase (oxaloacetate-decarboxylating)(NADP+)